MKTIEELIEDGLSQYQIANKLGIPRATLQSRMKKKGLTTKNSKSPNLEHNCQTCGETEPNEFYGRTKLRCKKCNNIKLRDKSKEYKLICIQTLGGKCSSCGYDKCMDALEFHHTNPNEKDENFNTWQHWSLDRRLDEIKKCILLCANCHREIHENDI